MPAGKGYPKPPHTGANDSERKPNKDCPSGFAWSAKKQACVQIRSGG